MLFEIIPSRPKCTLRFLPGRHFLSSGANTGLTCYSHRFSMIIDDRVTSMRVPLEHFHERLVKAEPQLDPLLDHLAIILRDTHRYWDPVCSSAIICSFLEFVASTLFQEREEVQQKGDVVESESWPLYNREMDGEPDAFAYMIFARDACPDVSVYLQAIPDMCTFINYNNDVLS